MWTARAGRARDYVRVVLVATVDAGDVAEALDLAWWTFRKAAGEDLAGWDLARAAAEVRPEAPLGTVGLLRGDQRGNDAPRDGNAAAELAESRRGADDDTEPAGPDIPAAGGHVNARELVAAQLGERLRSGDVGQRGDDGPRRGKPPRRDRPLCGGERVHDPLSRRCGISANESAGPARRRQRR
jgi:hypothetical protein